MIKRTLIALILLAAVQISFAVPFSVGVYGNVWVESRNNNLSAVSNADWRTTGATGYYQLDLSAVNLEGFQLRSRIGMNMDFLNGSLNGSYINPILSTFGYTPSLDPGINSNNQNNLIFRQFEASIIKTFTFSKSSRLQVGAYRGQDRSDVSQPYLSFFGGSGDSDTRTGLFWDGAGLFGFNTRGFINDYRSDYRDLFDPNVHDQFAYSVGGRISRDIFRHLFFNLTMGITAGGNQYFLKTAQAGLFGMTNTNFVNSKYYYNIVGADAAMNGDLPAVGSYYFFAGFGRSYAPEDFPYEYNPWIALLGNTNSLCYNFELRWNKAFKFDQLDLGRLFFTGVVFGRQPDYKIYLGGGADNNFREYLSLNYFFPVKALTLNTSIEYYHPYVFSNEQYHIWQVGNIVDNSTGFRTHVALNVLFKSGFSFNAAYDSEAGMNYLGSFIPTGISYLTLVVAGETSLGRISPQARIVALGDTNKQLISSGIEIQLNLFSWLHFYSRFAYVQSAGYWKSGNNVNWWNAYMQMQFFPGANSRITIEAGNGGDTANGFVATTSLINGAVFQRRVAVNCEFWM